MSSDVTAEDSAEVMRTALGERLLELRCEAVCGFAGRRRHDAWCPAPRRATSCSVRYCPAGVSALMAPAGEMWSVVTESPSLASTRAPVMSATGSGSIRIPSKYGGLRTYVETSSQA